MNKCYPDIPVPGTVSPPLSQATPPLLSSTRIAECVVGVSGIFGPAHLTAAHRCPFAPRWIIVAILSSHADLCTFGACDFGRGLVYKHRVIFLQRRGKCVRALGNLRQAGTFLQNVTSLNKHSVVLGTLSLHHLLAEAVNTCVNACVRTCAHSCHARVIGISSSFYKISGSYNPGLHASAGDTSLTRPSPGPHFSV